MSMAGNKFSFSMQNAINVRAYEDQDAAEQARDKRPEYCKACLPDYAKGIPSPTLTLSMEMVVVKRFIL